jgi:RNA polymerase sigma factor (sigma-70 family)
MPWTADPYYDGDPDVAAHLNSEEVHLPNEPHGTTAITKAEYNADRYLVGDNDPVAWPRRYQQQGKDSTNLLREIEDQAAATELEAISKAAAGAQPVTSAEELVDRWERGGLDTLIDELIRRLPARQREAFQLRHDGLTEREIAERMGVVRSVAHKHITKARAALWAEVHAHKLYVERHLQAEPIDHNITAEPEHDYVAEYRRISKLLNVGTANARWRVARILFDLLKAGVAVEAISQNTYLSPMTITELATEFAEG